MLRFSLNFFLHSKVLISTICNYFTITDHEGEKQEAFHHVFLSEVDLDDYLFGIKKKSIKVVRVSFVKLNALFFQFREGNHQDCSGF